MMTGYLTTMGEVGDRGSGEERKDKPSAVLRSGVGVVESVPTLCLDQIPPSFVSLIAGHDNMLDVHTRVLDRKLVLDLPDTTGDDRDGGETFLEGVTVAPVSEIAMSDVNGDVLLRTLIRGGYEIHPAVTHCGNGLVGLETKGGP